MDKCVFYVRDALFDELEARVRVKARFIFGQYEYVERIALRRRLLDKIKVAVSERVAVDDGRADDAARPAFERIEIFVYPPRRFSIISTSSVLAIV